MKKAIIIGASSGIGKELALLLSNNDYQVGITGRRMALLEELKNLKPESIKVLQMDITEISLLNDKLERLKIQLGGLDLLIICSGIGKLNPDLDFNLEKPTIDTNVTGFTFIADWTFDYFSSQNPGQYVTKRWSIIALLLKFLPRVLYNKI